MTITHREFLRILPKALAGWSYQRDGSEITVCVGDGVITITLEPQRERRIASLALPVTGVRFNINNVEVGAEKKFFLHFDRSYQRGGG